MAHDGRHIDECPECGVEDRLYAFNEDTGYLVAENDTDDDTVYWCEMCIFGEELSSPFFTHDGVEYHRCAGGCGTWVEQSEVVWATDDGKLTTMDGKPWCDSCLPPENE